MAYATIGLPARSGFVQTLATAARDFVARRAQRQAYLLTRRELSRLSDAMLADLGLVRAEIDRAAREATMGATK